MKINSISVHNFRSIKDARFDAHDYTVLVGPNNVGKSNLFAALRVFYEDGVKFSDASDFPKFEADDNESWVEIQYVLTDQEFANLKQDYRIPGNALRVRKYLKSVGKDRVRSNQSNIYGYEHGALSENLFYGAKNISEAKLGSVIYIPEVAKTDDTLKLTGPSALREVVAFVMSRVVKTSQSFADLQAAFEQFNEKFGREASRDGFSLNKLRDEINLSLKDWEVEFNLRINPARPEDIIKNLVSHYAIDRALDKEIDVKLLGQGLQRHLIYTLLKLSAQYTEKKAYERKEFSPELTLILFEEPEAFLHPGQQESLDASLRSLSREEGQQIFAATHSPIFVSKNVEQIPALVKLKKENGVTRLFQLQTERVAAIFQENNEFAQMLQDRLNDPSVEDVTKRHIREILGDTDEQRRMEEESIRYLLWLDSERCRAFFSDIVLVCEGRTEKALIDYLVENDWADLRARRIYVLDAMSKFNIHRYMTLFKDLGIYHSVLFDRDQDKKAHEYVNQFIEARKNECTRAVDFFDKDIETFLGLPYPPGDRRDRKPLSAIWHYCKGKIERGRIDALKNKIQHLV